MEAQAKQDYKQTEVGLIPSDWDVVRIDELTKRIGDGIHSTPNYDGKGEYNFINGNNLINGKITIFEDTKKVSEEEFFKHKRDLNDSTVLLSINGTIGNIAFYNHEKIVIGKSAAYINLNKKIDKQLFFQIIQSEFIKKYFENELTGSTIKNLGLGSIRNTPIPIPPLPEQKAIASALKESDVLIQSLEELIAKKKLIKQGSMQELLKPKEGWETKKLGEICEIKKGQLITEETRIDGLIPVIAGGKKPAYYHSKSNRIGKTITISGSGANAGYISFHNYPIFASDCSTINESNNYSIEFIYQWLLVLQNKIYKLQTGGAQPHIHPSDIAPLEIQIPNIEIQIYVANILFNMEMEIETLEHKLSKYKTIKQGMMQQLLTGKIRLI
jgi:type I restriction enzyme S subunit